MNVTGGLTNFSTRMPSSTMADTMLPHTMHGNYIGDAMAAMPIRTSGGLIASVTDSKDNLFSSNLMPMPPKFMFQERSGRVNWR